MSNSKNVSKDNDIKVWRSLDELNQEPKSVEAKKHEFNEAVTGEFDPADLPGLSRRKFLALLSASAAFTATACSDYQDKGEIVPYSKRPEEVLPGTANFYASTCSSCANACGILVKVREGRPIKIDGNPDHPVNKGKVCAVGQSSILNLYDPERLQAPNKDGRKTNWTTADNEIIKLLSESDKNKKVAIVTNSVFSPTTVNVINDFKNKYSNTEVYSYNIIDDRYKRAAWETCYGSQALPTIELDKADVVLSLDSDFLGRDGNVIENTRMFSSRREVSENNKVNRLYSVEGALSLTGSQADYRLRLRPDMQHEFVMSLLSEVISKSNSNISLDGNARTELAKYNLDGFAKSNNMDAIKLGYLVKDLIANNGKSIVMAGETLPENVHVAVNLLNEALGNTVLYDYNFSSPSNLIDDANDADQLVSDLKNKLVDVVIHFDSNPVYDLPGSYNYSELLKNANHVITLSEQPNETIANSLYVLPLSNSLESWGDFKSKENTFSLQQPVIAPIYNTRQKEAILLTWISEASSNYKDDIYHKYLMNSVKENIYANENVAVDFERYWFSLLHDGVVKVTNNNSSTSFNFAAIKNEKKNNSTKPVLHLQDSYFLGSGKYSNNGWLQELPHPVSKVAWDNYAAVSPKYANELGVENNSIIKITSKGTSFNIPVIVQPGTAENTVVVELGYGRASNGVVSEEVGFNANVLLNDYNSNSTWIVNDITVERTNETYELVSTQEHHSLDEELVKDFHLLRGIIREGTVKDYEEDPHFIHKGKHDIFSITTEHEYKEEKWTMSIDLNKCTGCSICVASCNVENNVPVVGKDQVAIGREMHWMRIDRYYSGTPEEPLVSNQPMLCQHCDNAPCENVCPVNATNHSQDGMNQMVYNRCVGTRYCANNCPYKVRRFNFYDFRDHFEDKHYNNDVTPLVHNPEVTVRSRGVMEKCSFCVQRIMDARSTATNEGRKIGGDDVVTACQQACPAEAIVFGNRNDETSSVNKIEKHELSYHVLEELNVKPGVSYMAKLRNTHSEDV